MWRLVTFVLLPFTYRPISLFIMLSFCYFVGGTLEREWGTAKFTLYYLSGMLFSVLSTVILSLATGYYGWSLSDAYYINLTMFLAFAVMYPDAQVWFYGVIPLKAKWLAWADIALMAWNIARSVRYGAYASALAAVVAILNFVSSSGRISRAFWGSRAVSGPDRPFNSSPPSGSRRRRRRSEATATSARSAAARTLTTRSWNSATVPNARAITASAQTTFLTTSTSQNKAIPARFDRAGIFALTAPRRRRTARFGKAGVLRHLLGGIFQPHSLFLQSKDLRHAVLQRHHGAGFGAAPATTRTYSPLGAFSS